MPYCTPLEREERTTGRKEKDKKNKTNGQDVGDEKKKVCDSAAQTRKHGHDSLGSAEQ